MMPELLLCLSQEDVEEPYQFNMTNIKVYSFEEALYHCFHYWKESIDDFLSEEFIHWVKSKPGLSFMASRILGLRELPSFGEKLLSFLSLTDYFTEAQLGGLKDELGAWEKRLEWERLKERGDDLMRLNEPAKAYGLYKKALEHKENAELLNNAALALLRLDLTKEAAEMLEAARVRKPDDEKIRLHLAEAYIYGHSFEKALGLLKEAEERGANPQVYYLYGELNMETGNTRYAIDYFEKALALDPDDYYVYRLTDVYVKLRFYEKALENLNKAKARDTSFYLKQAEVYAAGDNVPAAIKCMEKALLSHRNSVELWIRLAMYHRLNYDLSRGAAAIQKALSLAPADDRARLELARIQKAQGKTREYQGILNVILQGFKRKYRELEQG